MPAVKIGDIVYLNSGSPPLQVVGIEPPDPVVMVETVWLSNQGFAHIWFPMECLSYDNNPEWETIHASRQ